MYNIFSSELQATKIETIPSSYQVILKCKQQKRQYSGNDWTYGSIKKMIGNYSACLTLEQNS